MGYTPRECAQLSSFFATKRAQDLIVPLLYETMRTSPQVTLAQFHVILSRISAKAPPQYRPLLTIERLTDDPEATKPHYERFLLLIPPPPVIAPPPPLILPNGGILAVQCDDTIRAVQQKLHLDFMDAKMALQEASFPPSKRVKPSFSLGHDLYHDTRRSKDGAGSKNAKMTGVDMITFFYEKHGDNYYLVAWGSHVDDSHYCVEAVVGPGQFSVGASLTCDGSGPLQS